MNYNYLRPGIGNAASYQAAGIPWYTSSLAPALSTTSVVVNLPQVTKFVTIKNKSTTEDSLRITFNNDSVVDNENYILLESGESFSADFRVTDIHLISDSETPVPFTIVNGLTNIRRQEMTQQTPKAPNLLKWVQKEKLIADDPDQATENDFFGFGISANEDGTILAARSSGDDQNGPGAGAVYIFQSGSSGYQQVQKLTASFGTDGNQEISPQGDYFGISISLNSVGDVVTIGSFFDEENGPGAGAVYIFQSGSSGYQQVQKITASFNTDGSPEVDTSDDFFGIVNTIDSTGKKLAIQASNDRENGGPGAGAVYIFQSGSSGYQQVQKLTASFGTDGNPEISPQGDSFGSSIAFDSSGDILVIGSTGDEEAGGNSAGAVYIFQSGSSGYQQVQKLIASGDSDPAEDDFGSSISLSSDNTILIVGSANDDANGGDNSFAAGAGSVYVFQSGSSGYQQVQKLTASGDTNPDADQFGQSVTISPDKRFIFVSSWNDDANGGDNTFGGGAGSVYVFENSVSGYRQIQKITASYSTSDTPEQSPENDRFGQDIKLAYSNDKLFIGAPGDEENGGANAGSVYIFRYTRDY